MNDTKTEAVEDKEDKKSDTKLPKKKKEIVAQMVQSQPVSETGKKRVSLDF